MPLTSPPPSINQRTKRIDQSIDKSIILAELVDMHRLDNPILIVHGRLSLHRHAPDGLTVFHPAPDDISVEPAVAMRQFDVPLRQTFRPPRITVGAFVARDPLLAFAADVPVVVETTERGASAR